MPTSSTQAGASWRFDAVAPSYSSQTREIWSFIDLYPTLFVRAMFLIYQKSLLGIGWQFINVLAITLPLALVVSHVLNLTSGTLPPPVFVLSGLTCWTLFRYSAQFMMKGLSGDRSLLRRFSIPPFLLMSAKLANGVVAFLVTGLVMLGAIAYYWITTGALLLSFDWKLLLVVPVCLATAALAIGVSCFTSIVNYVIADTFQALRHVFTFWALATPVIYSSDMIPAAYRPWYYLNPMAGLVDTFRWALFDPAAIDWALVSISYGVALVILLGGLAFFLKFQRRILDFS